MDKDYDRMPEDPHKGRGWRITKAILTSAWFKFLVAVAILSVFGAYSAKITEAMGGDNTLSIIGTLVPTAYLFYCIWRFFTSHRKSYLENHDVKSAYLRHSKQMFLCPKCRKDALVFRYVEKGDSGTPGTSFSVGGVGGTIYTGGYGYDSDAAHFECPRCGHVEEWTVNTDKAFKVIKIHKLRALKENINEKREERKEKKQELAELNAKDKLYKEQKKQEKLNAKAQKAVEKEPAEKKTAVKKVDEKTVDEKKPTSKKSTTKK